MGADDGLGGPGLTSLARVAGVVLESVSVRVIDEVRAAFLSLVRPLELGSPLWCGCGGNAGWLILIESAALEALYLGLDLVYGHPQIASGLVHGELALVVGEADEML